MISKEELEEAERQETKKKEKGNKKETPEERVKGRECISCKRLFDETCKGKPRGVERCNGLEAR